MKDSGCIPLIHKTGRLASGTIIHCTETPTAAITYQLHPEDSGFRKPLWLWAARIGITAEPVVQRLLLKVGVSNDWALCLLLDGWQLGSEVHFPLRSVSLRTGFQWLKERVWWGGLGSTEASGSSSRSLHILRARRAALWQPEEGNKVHTVNLTQTEQGRLGLPLQEAFHHREAYCERRWVEVRRCGVIISL